MEDLHGWPQIMVIALLIAPIVLGFIYLYNM
jgi:hypothetical protein